jgi:putative methionine-R-sulfoxide reductase with GAF domain
MKAQLTVIAPKSPAAEFMLQQNVGYLIGRAEGNDIVIPEPSVSRQHAKLGFSDQLWLLSDLDSVNGIRCNGIPQQRCILADGSLVIVGNVPVLFSTVSQQQQQQQQDYNHWRYQQVAQLKHQALAASQRELTDFLAEALKLCQMQRAVLLLGSDLDNLKVEASLGVTKDEHNANNFFGSLGALQKVLTSQQALVSNDISQHHALSHRASIKLKQLSALACLPLVYQGRVVGLFYIDSKQPSKYLSAFDFELLQALVNSVTLMLYSQQLDEELHSLALNVGQSC